MGEARNLDISKNEEVVHISGMNETPAGDRVVIGFFGRRNVGKSSVVNAVTGQQLAVVSEVKGTTTDPVQKAMELLPLGPVLIIDTPGIDDAGALGEQRVRQTRKVLNKTDIAVLVVDAAEGMTPIEEELVALFKAKRTPYVIAYNKNDLVDKKEESDAPAPEALDSMTPDAAGSESVYATGQGHAALAAGRSIRISALHHTGIAELKECIARAVRTEDRTRCIVGDLIAPDDFVILVVPIDSAAPKGRLILPQQQVIRDVLEAGASAIVVRESELAGTLKDLGKKPRLVITDSQAFEKVNADTPPEVQLTSFSILFARYKGDLMQNVKGVRALDRIKDGDRILICEGCTHHRQCDDIGTVKLPRWIRDFTGAKPAFEFTSGGDFPDDLSGYQLIVHCGACMLNEREMKYRLAQAADAGVPMTNYGILIAYVHGILHRTLSPFRALSAAVSAVSAE
ncbi:MAG: [FeFe] hydrogenase H-cluster maturation GTPase HydF [Clostridiales Family XIII bacterium]|jgi:small GTP-binding protein|nr:[FeFe] hydrogenase H-cluster maturation GTPase HydF [Clostridiales Family XIII bacterium]